MSINLKELSARLGLSPTTVSRAIAGYSDVSPITRERVRQAALDAGYQPNRAARQVAMGRADAVGIVYAMDDDFLGNPSFLAMLGSLAKRLRQANLDLLLAAAPEYDEMKVYERMVRGRRVDALLVAHTLVEDPRIDYLQQSGMPFVAYGRTARPDDYPWFDFDNAAVSALAVDALLRLGHRRIAYIHSPLSYNFAFQRHAGYLASLRAAGIEPDPDHIFSGAIGRRTGYRAGESLLSLPRRPTAVIVDNNAGGIGLLRSLLDAGVAIGQDISVIVNEGMSADSVLPRLEVASVLQPTSEASGATMGDMLLSVVEDPKQKPPQQILRQPVFCGGNTIGPPRD